MVMDNEVKFIENNKVLVLKNTTYKICEDVYFTRSAVNRVLLVAKKRELEDGSQYFLRFLISSGGCYGFSYIFKFEKDLDDEDQIIVDSESQKIVCALSPKILKFVSGATIDFVDELASSFFTVVSNPNSSGGCGCGNSFSLSS